MNNNHYHKIIESLSSRRYMTLRYITAFLFFFNLYWMLALALSNRSMIFVPLISFMTYIFAYADLYLVVKNENHQSLNWTRIVYTYNFLAVLVTLIITFISKEVFFPFITSREYAIGGVLFNFFLIILAGFKIYQVTSNKDRTYKKIETFKNQKTNKKGRLDV